MQPKFSRPEAIWLCYHPWWCPKTQRCSTLWSISLLAPIWEHTRHSSHSSAFQQQMEAQDCVGWMQSTWRGYRYQPGSNGLLTSRGSCVPGQQSGGGKVSLFYGQHQSGYFPQREQLNLLSRVAYTHNILARWPLKCWRVSELGFREFEPGRTSSVCQHWRTPPIRSSKLGRTCCHWVVCAGVGSYDNALVLGCIRWLLARNGDVRPPHWRQVWDVGAGRTRWRSAQNSGIELSMFAASHI